MIKRLLAVCLVIILLSLNLLAQTADETPAKAQSSDETVTAEFKVYILIKAGQIKKAKKPEFAYRQLKSYPVKVREFLLKSKYTGLYGKEAVLKADNMLAALSENKRKNAVQVVFMVHDYINLSITAQADEPKPCLTQSQCHALPEEVLAAGEGSLIERNRLAIAMLKHFSIPARMAFWDDHYVVQYFLKPLETEKIDAAWHIMDFTGSYEAAENKVEPAAWHPVTSKELLAESWEEQNITLVKKHVKNTRMEINEAEALALFTNIEMGNAPEMEGNTLIAKYYCLKEITYEITAKQVDTGVKMEFTLPFNETQPFKTLRYFVSGGENLKPVFRKTHTMINPPNSGLVYTLPVTFEFILKSH